MSSWINLLLSSTVDGAYARLRVASWAVVVGVAIEEIPRFLKFASYLRKKFDSLALNTGGVAWLKKREEAFETVGFMLLVVGLVLEIRFQGALESLEKDTRVAQEIVVQQLRVQATNAETKIAVLNGVAENARERANKAALDLAMFKEGRHFTTEKARKFLAAIHDFLAHDVDALRVPVRIVPTPLTPETYFFCDKLAKTLSMFGVQVTFDDASIRLRGNAPSWHIVVSAAFNNQAGIRFAKAISDDLNAVGFWSRMQTGGDDAAVTVVVGEEPPPFIQTLPEFKLPN